MEKTPSFKDFSNLVEFEKGKIDLMLFHKATLEAEINRRKIVVCNANGWQKPEKYEMRSNWYKLIMEYNQLLQDIQIAAEVLETAMNIAVQQEETFKKLYSEACEKVPELQDRFNSLRENFSKLPKEHWEILTELIYSYFQQFEQDHNEALSKDFTFTYMQLKAALSNAEKLINQ